MQQADTAMETATQPNKEIDHIIGVYSELQKWALKDIHTDHWELEALDQGKKSEYRKSGWKCGVWEGFYVLVGCPIFIAVKHNMLIPFEHQYNIWITWGIILATLLLYPLLHFFIAIAGVTKIKGKFTYKVWSIFLNTKAMVFFSTIICGILFYGWLIPEQLKSITFSYDTPLDIQNALSLRIQQANFVLINSLSIIIPFSLLITLLPIAFLRIVGIKNKKKAQIIESLKND